MWDESFDFLLGEFLLITSVTEANVKSRQVYLPEKEWWMEWRSNKWVSGGQTVTIETPLEKIPFFVKSGAILPFSDIDVMEKDLTRKVYLFPSPDTQESNFVLYEDDGVSVSSPKKLVHFTLSSFKNQILLKVSTEGDWKLQYRLYFLLPKCETRKFVLDSKELKLKEQLHDQDQDFCCYDCSWQ